MNATELMIGDWMKVACNNTLIKVCGIDEVGMKSHLRDMWGYDGIEPIPLTPEMLEKNGFKHKHDREPIKRQYWIINIGGGSIKVKVNRSAFLFDILGVPFREGYYKPSFNAHIQYVHEFQHALRLCGLNELADNLKI